MAIGFGAQSLVKDFLAGIFILVEDQYGVGDIVDVGEATGTVEAVSLRTTRLRDVNGTVWHVPNGQILRVGNKSQQWARALLDLAVAHGTDIGHGRAGHQGDGRRACGRTRRGRGQILEEPEVWGVERHRPRGVTIRLVVKTLPAEQFDVIRELRGRIKVALDDAGVEMPSRSAPQRIARRRRRLDLEAAAPPRRRRPRPRRRPGATKTAAKRS